MNSEMLKRLLILNLMWMPTSTLRQKSLWDTYVISNKQKIDDIKIGLENYITKTNKDLEIIQYECVERLLEWLKLFTKEGSED